MRETLVVANLTLIGEGIQSPSPADSEHDLQVSRMWRVHLLRLLQKADPSQLLNQGYCV